MAIKGKDCSGTTKSKAFQEESTLTKWVLHDAGNSSNFLSNHFWRIRIRESWWRKGLKDNRDNESWQKANIHRLQDRDWGSKWRDLLPAVIDFLSLDFLRLCFPSIGAAVLELEVWLCVQSQLFVLQCLSVFFLYFPMMIINQEIQRNEDSDTDWLWSLEASRNFSLQSALT